MDGGDGVLYAKEKYKEDFLGIRNYALYIYDIYNCISAAESYES